MLHTLSFLKTVKQGTSKLDISRAVDQLQSFYSCPTSWQIELILSPINGAVGFRCSKETDNWSVHDSQQFIDDHTKDTGYQDLKIVGESLIVVCE